jgi:hypothetical protein
MWPGLAGRCKRGWRMRSACGSDRLLRRSAQNTGRLGDVPSAAGSTEGSMPCVHGSANRYDRADRLRDPLALAPRGLAVVLIRRPKQELRCPDPRASMRRQGDGIAYCERRPPRIAGQACSGHPAAQREGKFRRDTDPSIPSQIGSRSNQHPYHRCSSRTHAGSA